MRFLAPIIAFAAAFYVYSANQGATNEFIFLFPLNNIFPDPAEAAERSWQLLVVIGALWTISDIRGWLQDRAAKPSGEGDAE